MSLLKRFAYYFAGFVIGTLILFFILDKKEASCDYSPNSRVLKNINTKDIQIQSEVIQYLSENKIDTSFISSTLENGNVLFKESNTQLDSCKIYVIKGPERWGKWKLSLRNCDEVVKIFDIEVVN